MEGRLLCPFQTPLPQLLCFLHLFYFTFAAGVAPRWPDLWEKEKAAREGEKRKRSAKEPRQAVFLSCMTSPRLLVPLSHTICGNIWLRPRQSGRRTGIPPALAVAEGALALVIYCQLDARLLGGRRLI